MTSLDESLAAVIKNAEALYDSKGYAALTTKQRDVLNRDRKDRGAAPLDPDYNGPQLNYPEMEERILADHPEIREFRKQLEETAKKAVGAQIRNEKEARAYETIQQMQELADKRHADILERLDAMAQTEFLEPVIMAPSTEPLHIPSLIDALYRVFDSCRSEEQWAGHRWLNGSYQTHPDAKERYDTWSRRTDAALDAIKRVALSFAGDQKAVGLVKEGKEWDDGHF